MVTPAAPWIVLCVVLGMALATVVGLGAGSLLRRGPADPPAAPAEAPEAVFGEDDLPGFLESPPGSGTTSPGPAGGWAALSSAALPAPSPAAALPALRPEADDRRAVRLLAAASLVVLLLVGAAAAVAGASRSPAAAGSPVPSGTAAGGLRPAPSSDRPSPAPGKAGALAGSSVPRGPRGVAARLAFEGVVLEQRAVGITVAYPRLDLTASGDGKQSDRAVAHLVLPTYNCLAAEVPADPVAAGCSPALTEYADLAAPDLTVVRSGAGRGGGARIAGRFPTYLRPSGSEPVWSGRRYDLVVTVAPAEAVRERDGRAPRGWLPAAGTLRLGDRRANAAGSPAVNAVRLGG